MTTTDHCADGDGRLLGDALRGGRQSRMGRARTRCALCALRRSVVLDSCCSPGFVDRCLVVPSVTPLLQSLCVSSSLSLRFSNSPALLIWSLRRLPADGHRGSRCRLWAAVRHLGSVTSSAVCSPCIVHHLFTCLRFCREWRLLGLFASASHSPANRCFCFPCARRSLDGRGGRLGGQLFGHGARQVRKPR